MLGAGLEWDGASLSLASADWTTGTQTTFFFFDPGPPISVTQSQVTFTNPQATGNNQFNNFGWATIGVLGMLTALTWLIDFLAAALGAKRLGASPRAFWGAAFGAFAGIFFGLPGIILGPFVGAVVAELSGGRNMQEAGMAGYGAWIGVVIGSAAKLAIAFLMLGIFVFDQWMGTG